MAHFTPPSRWEQIGRALAYLFTALIGFGAAWFPRVLSDSGENTTERLGLVMWIWVGFMATAVPAAVATLMGRHRIEFILIPLFTVALAVANLNAWVNVTYDPTIMARACASSALICLLCVRWIGLNRLNRTPFPWTLIRLSK